MTSGDLEYALFSSKEIERRHNKARELMAQQGIDALFITGEENFQYFTGTSASIGLHYSLTRPSVFILPLEKDPIIVTQMRDFIILSTYVKDIRSYFDVLRFPHDEVLEALREVGLKNKRIGAELGREQRMGMPVGDYLALVEAMPDVEFVDAAQIILKLRMVKSEEELVYVKRAADVTGRARQKMFDSHIFPGMTERDVARTIRRLILEEGGDRTSFVHLQLGIPGSKNQFHYDRPLKKGTVLAVDAGAYVRMYTVDYPRMAVLGKATDEMKRLYSAVLKVNKTMADALRPGIKCSEIHAIGVKAIEEAGVEVDRPEKLKKGRMGHGQGILFTEPPSVTAGDHTVLEPGIVLSTEPGVKSGNIHFLWEDTHVITEDGHEQLTLETDELREIAF